MKHLFAIFTLSCVCAQSQTNTIVFEDDSVGISFRLPEGWIAFPKEMFHKVAGFGAKLEPTPPPREILAVFQRSTNIDHPAFPRVVVHVQKGASIGERQFRGLHAAPLIEITVAQSMGFPGRPQFMKSARYDSDKQYLTFNFDCYIEDFGYIQALGRSFLTAEGLVNIYAYAPAADFAAAEGELVSVLSTLQISPEHRYHPDSNARETPTEAKSAWKSTVFGLGVLVVAPVALFLFWSRFRRDEVYSDEI